MADTRRTYTALATLFADNTAGAISAQDLRDFLVSMKMHTSSSAPTATDDETSGFDVGHEWLETSTPAIYKCRDATTDSAEWEKIWPTSVSVALDDLTDVDTTGSSIGDVLADTGSGWAPLTLKGVATSGAAEDVTYDNGTTGLSSTDVQDAIDEVYSAITGTAWGGITGTLTDQTDLATALSARLNKLATINSFSGNHTLDSDDSGAYVRITAAGTVTLPDGLDAGFQCVIVNATDSGAVALSAATTLTLPTGFEAAVQNRKAVTVIHVGANAWEAHGALVEST